MDWIDSFAGWAWARHHNVLSWYIRPLFLLPYCYFAYRRSWTGMGVTFVALLTSMFWFPAPETVSPAVLSALAAEEEYLLGEWNVQKVVMALLVPATFVILAAAFWKRSLWLGLAVVNGMVLIKIAWTFVYFEPGAIMAHLLPALTGLLLINGAAGVFFMIQRVKSKSNKPS